jgi:hypothetical protein
MRTLADGLAPSASRWVITPEIRIGRGSLGFRVPGKNTICHVTCMLA